MNAAQAWSMFWAEQGPGSRCLANAPRELLELLDNHWRTFAMNLPGQSKVLDLACGGGVVGCELLSAQPGLRVTGIDIALIPPSRDPRNELIPWTPIESLPFEDGSFDAAVSQFGYEYGQTEEAAKEVARVLPPNAPLSLILHHSMSPLIAGMRQHKRALDGLCSYAVSDAFVAGDAGALGEQIAMLKRECPADPIIDQAAHGLVAHIRQDEGRRSDIWRTVAEALEPERITLDALNLRCVGHDDVTYWTGPLSKAFDLAEPTAVRIPSGEPIAWLIEGRRRPLVAG